MKQNPGARLWRSLAEYENDPEFQKYLQNEFGTPLTDAPPNSNERRRFMQLMAASFSLAGVAGCRWEQDHMLPMARQRCSHTQPPTVCLKQAGWFGAPSHGPRVAPPP